MKIIRKTSFARRVLNGGAATMLALSSMTVAAPTILAQTANASALDPFSVETMCVDEMVQLKVTVRQDRLPDIPSNANAWRVDALSALLGGNVRYTTDFGTERNTLTEGDHDFHIFNTGLQSIPAGTASARVTGEYKTGLTWLFTGKSYDRTLSVQYDAENCDNTPPTATFTHSNNNDNTLVNTDVQSQLHASEPILTPLGWTKINDTTFEKTSSENNKGNMTISDLAGNTTSVFFEVKRIDKTQPVFTIENGSVFTTASVVVTVNEPNIDKILVDDNKVVHAGSKPLYTVVVTGEGGHTVVALDKAGNSSSVSFTIDSIAPTVSKIRINNQTVAGQFVHGTNCSPIKGLFDVSGDLNVTAVIEDASDVVSASYKVRKMNAGGCTQSNVYSSNATALKQSSKNVKNWNQVSPFDTTVLENGTYAIFLTTKDSAGNVTTKYIHLAVQNETDSDSETPSDTGTNGNTTSGGNSQSNFGSAPLPLATQTPLLPITPRGDIFTSSADNQESEPEVLGTSTQNKVSDNSSKSSFATVTTPEVKGASDFAPFGVAWYWWLLILAAVSTAAWWVIAAIRRQGQEV